MQLEALLKEPRALPEVPEVVARLIASFESEDVDIASIASEIDQDPVLAAHVLRLSNASLFRRFRPVATVTEGIMVLGLNKVRALVISSALSNCFHAVGGINLNQFWNYSLASAAVSKYICEPLALDQNIAFTTGLLHAVGELVMHAGMPEFMLDFNRYVPLLDLGRANAQYEALGYSYAEVGAALSQEWRFPRPMTEAIEFHTHPLSNDSRQPLAAVLHLAAWRARLYADRADLHSIIHSYPDDVGLLLGIDPDRLVTDDLPPLQDLAPI